MTDEELQRKFDVVADHLAGLAVAHEKAGERIVHLENIVTRLANATLERFDKTDERLAALIDSQIRADDRSDKLDERLAALIDSQIRADDRSDRTDERLATLVEAQVRMEDDLKRTDSNLKKTDENLRNLIAVVDRYFREGRNGNA